MASATLNPYVDNTNHQALVLKSTTDLGAVFMVSGRALGAPFELELIRKVNPNSLSNDHSIVRLTRKEANAASGKLATLQVTLDCSIPKDVTVLTLTEQKKLVSLLVSLLNESTAMEATNANITAILEGRDL
jgi:hypothetical protein